MYEVLPIITAMLSAVAISACLTVCSRTPDHKRDTAKECEQKQELVQDTTSKILNYQMEYQFIIPEDYHKSMSYAETLKKNACEE